MPDGVISKPNVKLWQFLKTTFFLWYRRRLAGRRLRLPVLCVFCVFFPDWLTSVAPQTRTQLRNRNFPRRFSFCNKAARSGELKSSFCHRGRARNRVSSPR